MVVREDSAGSADGHDFVEALSALGFSQYEARCYVGLAGAPQTGYAVAKVTGVPQPKVYEALRKLVARGAARQLLGEPVRFAAVPPSELLDDLQVSFEDRLDHARRNSANLGAPTAPLPFEPVSGLADRATVISVATESLHTASRRIYVSATANELRSMSAPILDCVARGVDVIVLCFGRNPFGADSGVKVFVHASTKGAVYRHHQARHVALVVDSRVALFGIAADERTWTGVHTTSQAIVAVVKGYIRHDIDLQQVFSDFSAELVEAYGPGLQGLETYRAEPPATADERVLRAQAG